MNGYICVWLQNSTEKIFKKMNMIEEKKKTAWLKLSTVIQIMTYFAYTSDTSEVYLF